MLKWKNFFRFVAIVLSGTLLMLLLIALAFTNDSRTSLTLFSIAFISNYLFTAAISLKLFYTNKKSNLFINFYLFCFIFLPFISTFIFFILFNDDSDKNDIHIYDEQMEKYKKYENYEFTKKISDGGLMDLPDKVFYYNYFQHHQPIYNKNSLKLLISPSEHITALIDLIKSANKFIHIEYYIFRDGHVLNYILIILKEKIQNGLEVKVLIDDWGNFWSLKRSTRRKMKAMGIQLKFFNPIFKRSHLWWQFRNHNKIIVVDNERAMYGSCNISDEYFNITSYFFQTTEKTVLIEGNIVNSLNVLFCAHWNMYKSDNNKKELDIRLQGFDYLTPTSKIEEDGALIQLVNSSPISNDQVIKNNLIQLIHGAKKSLTITTPYFYPPKDVTDALRIASKSGIKIKILLPKQADFANFYITIQRQLFLELLNSGIEIYEYFGFNHEKITVIDDDVVYFGSYNWDYRALYLNFESALLIQDVEFAKLVKNVIHQQFENSHLINVDEFIINKLPFKTQCINSFIRLLKPFL